jgi:hypothetical protein
VLITSVGTTTAVATNATDANMFTATARRAVLPWAGRRGTNLPSIRAMPVSPLDFRLAPIARGGRWTTGGDRFSG